MRFACVSKTYDGENLVIQDLSLDIARGELLTFLGPSGSGKTTSLMMLAGFETPTSGQIYLKGARVDQVPPHKRGLGFVPQSHALFVCPAWRWMTGESPEGSRSQRPTRTARRQAGTPVRP